MMYDVLHDTRTYFTLQQRKPNVMMMAIVMMMVVGDRGAYG